MHYSWDEVEDMFYASEQWQIEEVAHRGLKKRKAFPDAWAKLTGRIER